VTEDRADFLERHYTLGELAAAWHMSRKTLQSWFRNEAGVIRYGQDKLKKGRHRTHVSVRVPESVARRVYRAHTGRSLQAAGN
jgi:AraC-like DNA-binding protein